VVFFKIKFKCKTVKTRMGNKCIKFFAKLPFSLY